MSADTINADTLQLPVWTVNGTNWHVDIPLDEMNAQFDAEMQAVEAASKAIMVLKGLDDTYQIILDEGETQAFLGPTMIVHLKDTDPREGKIAFTHVVFANQGFYKESAQMREIFEKHRAQLEQDFKEHLAAFKTLLNEELKKNKKVPKKKTAKRTKRKKK